MVLKYNDKLNIWEVRVGAFTSYAPTRKAALKLGQRLCGITNQAAN